MDKTKDCGALAHHFAEIRQIDVRAEEETKRIRTRLAFEDREFKANHWEPARKAAKAIEKAIAKSLKPHRVEFTHMDGFHINHIDKSVHPSFSFEVWPHKVGADRFITQARTPIKAGITPRDEAELRHALAGIKAAAECLAEMLYSPSGERAARTEASHD